MYKTVVSAILSPIEAMTGGSAGGIWGTFLSGAMRMMGSLLLRVDEEYAEIAIS